MIYVGIDWADEHHAVFLTNDEAETLAQFTIEHSPAGLEALRARVAKREPDPAQVLCALERKTGLLAHALLELGYQVYHINPKVVDRYRDRHHVSGAKTDPIDGCALGHALRTDRHRFVPLRPLDELTQQVAELVKVREPLVRQRTRVVNQLTACLKGYYPVGLKLFSSVQTQIAQALLRQWPSPQALAQVSWADWQAFLKAHGYPAARGAKVYERLQQPQLSACPAVVQAQGTYLIGLLDQLAAMQRALAEVDSQLAGALGAHERYPILISLPGASDALAARLLRFFAPTTGATADVDMLRALAGTAPVPWMSGKGGGVRMRRACQKDFRDTMHQFAFCSTQCSAWAQAYYRRHRNRGDKHAGALRKLAHHWIRIIVGMIRTATPYNEAIHLARARQRRHKR